MTSLKVDIVGIDTLGEAELAAWRAMLAANPALASPYFRPEFARVAGGVSPRAAVAVFSRGGETVGFFPHQRRGGAMQPLAAPMNDYHGVIARPGMAPSLEEAAEVLGATRLNLTAWVGPTALAALRPDGWADAAHGIMTTDTRPKWAARRAAIGERVVTVTGIAKGAGMIRPDMATMLAFVATDAAVDETALRRILGDAVADSFNAITVDGDTSTNDACVLLATGRAGATVPDAGPECRDFAAMVREVCVDLAQAIIRDGEGATKFIAVSVEGGRDPAECRQVAYAIAHSPLVKTAFFASDPNWGRILAAVGRAGLAELNLERVAIYLDEVCIVRDGGRAPDYTEERGQRVMRQPEITIRVELGRGGAAARIWTTDLSFDYVRINAEYRT